MDDAVIDMWEYAKRMVEGETFYAKELGGYTYHFRKSDRTLQCRTWCPEYGYCWVDYHEEYRESW